jgi:hypothetical protein
MPGWKFVPVIVNMTVLFRHPDAGVTMAMVGANLVTVNKTGDVLVAPLRVVTLTAQVFPNGESAGTVKLPVIAVGVTLVSHVVTLVPCPVK